MRALVVIATVSALAWSAPALAQTQQADFNGDGFADLAVGVPGENVGGQAGAGAVNVLYGGLTGFSEDASQIWHQDVALVQDAPEAADGFGRALATGDFDRDGFADLAVGVPGEDLGPGLDGAGVVHVLFGSADGLTAADNQLWHQDQLGIGGTAEFSDRFGFALVGANFGKSAAADLAIGAEGEAIGGASGAGAVHILFGGREGLEGTGSQLWHENRPGVSGEADGNERFGGTLAAADLGRNRYADLAVGAYQETVGGHEAAGAVHVFYGGRRGLSADEEQFWHQNRPGIAGTAAVDDFFGNALAAADFGKSRHADLAIGVLGEDVGAVADAGAVSVLYGGANGLTGAGDQLWHQDRSGVADVAETGDELGYSLAAADFGRSRHAELAIGAPGEALQGTTLAGAVNVLYGTSGGLSAARDQFWHQDRASVPDAAEAGDSFGEALAAANFGSSRQADLAVGVPDESVGALAAAGAINVFFGASGGLNAFGDELWHQDSPGVPDNAESSDRFGAELGPRR